MQLFATCAFGLEKLVKDEIKALGLAILEVEDGRVTFEGEPLDLIRANLWLRCADRVQIKMGSFEAKTFDELFDAVHALEWEKYIRPADVFPVDATSVKSALHSEPAIQSIVKKAVVKRLQKAHQCELLPEDSEAVYQIMVKANKDHFVVSIDSSGESLHRRGYRNRSVVAPIKETLAAAMITLSDWISGERTLIDLFCGSGTFAVEAAMIAQNRAPGLRRNFAFENWPWLAVNDMELACEEAIALGKPEAEFKAYSFDINADVLEIAEENSALAGYPQLNFKRADFRDLDFSQFENCTFIANPPYGLRLEDEESAETMYRELGQKFREAKNCSLFLITSNENFPRYFGRRADKNRKLFNGKIRCYLFSFYAE